MERRPHRRPRVALCVLVALALAFWGGRAEAKKDPAVELFRRAVEAYKAQDYARAERLFLASWDLAERPPTMCNLGLTYEQWGGHQEQAIQAYERCAARDASGRYQKTALERAARVKAAMTAAATAAEAKRAERERADEEPAELLPPGPVPEREQPRMPPQAPVVERRAPPVPPTPPAAGSEGGAAPRWWLWSGIGGGVVAAAVAGVGILYVKRSNDAAADLEERYPDHMIPADSLDERRLERAYSDGVFGKRLYIAAGVLAVGAAACVVVDLTRHKEPAATATAPHTFSVGIAPTPGGASLSATLQY